MKIVLEWYEQEMARLIGGLRTSESRRRQLQHDRNLFQSEEKTAQVDIEGAATEIAVAKALNKYWHGSVNADRTEPDVGHMIQVRSTSHENGKLIVTEKDYDDQFYFLVRGLFPNYDVVGYLKGSDAKQERFLQNPGGRGRAYFVPAKYLRPVEELLNK